MWIYLGYMIEECFSWYVSWLTKVLIAWNSDTSSTYATVFRKWKREFANATCCWGQVIVLERYLRKWCQVQRLGLKATELCFPQNLAQGHCTLEIDMEPESHLSEKENHLSNLSFWVLCQFSGGYRISLYFLHLLHKFICPWFKPFELPPLPQLRHEFLTSNYLDDPS